jgi:hypothetical protein
MVRVWNRVFIPATVFVGAGVVVLIGDIGARSGQSGKGDVDVGWLAVGVAVAAALLLCAWTWLSRPRLGSQD